MSAQPEREQEEEENCSRLTRRRVGHRRDADLLEELRQRDQLWRNKYEEMLGSLDGSMVEQVILKAGVRDYFEKLKERDRLNVETIQQLKAELDSKRRQVDRLQSRLDESEAQCIKYYQALMESQAKREHLEAQQRAHEEQELERERLLQVSRSMNNLSSYASSMIADCDIPPPPPISVEEILGMTAPNNLPDNLATMPRSPFYSGRAGALVDQPYGQQRLSGAGSISGASQKSKLSRSGSMRYPLTTTTTTTTTSHHQLAHINRSTNHNNSMRQY